MASGRRSSPRRIPRSARSPARRRSSSSPSGWRRASGRRSPSATGWSRRARARATVHLGGDRAPHRRRLPGGARGVKGGRRRHRHGHREELAESLPALVPQVDEVVVIANTPGSAPADALGARVIENARPASYAANINAGTRATTASSCSSPNPDAVPEPGAIAVLREFMEAHPRCGVAGPQLVDPDGSWQPSRRRFPDRRRHARPAHAAPPPPPAARAPARPLPARRASHRARRDRLDARRLPAPAPGDARRARRLRRGLPHVRRGDRPLLPGGEGGLGALVRAGGRRPPPLGRGDRQELLHEAHALALARHPPLRPQAPRAAQGA